MNSILMNKIKHIVIQVAVALIAAILIAADVLCGVFFTMVSVTLNQRPYDLVETKPDPSIDTQYYKSDYDYDMDKLRAAQKEYSKTVQEEGSVLLKNANLPLSEGLNITLLGGSIGEGSSGFLYGGGGSGQIDTSASPNLKEAFEGAGYKVNPVMWNYYNTGSGVSTRSLGSGTVGEKALSVMGENEKNSIATYKDAAIVVIGRTGTENLDIPFFTTEDASKHPLEFSQNELDLINYACENFPKVVLLLNTMQTMEISPVLGKNNLSVLWIGAGGEDGLLAIPEILNGKRNPSGRLVDTYATDLMKTPAVVNQGKTVLSSADGDNLGAYYVYSEGIYVGYRYYETRYADKVANIAKVGNFDYNEEVIYPFGYGLSYTSFSYSDFSISDDGNNLTAHVKVKNTGSREGKETVQIYMQSPYTDYDKKNAIEKSAIELVGFEKTKMLKPNEETNITVEIPKKNMRVYDAKEAKTYIVEAGDYFFSVGYNVHDALNNVLAKQNRKISDGMTSAGNVDLAVKYTVGKTDSTNYSVGKKGDKIENQFETADINYYKNGFKYLSRSDWEGTFPKLYSNGSFTATDAMVKDFNIKLPENLDDEAVTTGKNNGLTLASMIGLDYDHESWNDLLDQLSLQDLCDLTYGYFSTAKLPSIAKPQMVDKDGPAGINSSIIGSVKGYGYATEILLGSTFSKELVNKQGVFVGEDSLVTLVNGWYAPGVNIHRSSFSGRNFEYYSEDPYLSGVFAGEVISGARTKGLYCYMKHFALNDQETNRSVAKTFANEQTIREIYLKAFEIPVVDYGANAMMLSMNYLGMYWVGQHPTLLSKVVRGEWGFKGAIITDMTARYGEELNAISVINGTDLFLNSKTFTVKYLQDNPGIQKAMRNTAHNVLFVAANSNGMNGLSATTKVVDKIPPWVYWLAALNIVLVAALTVGTVYNIKIMKRNGGKNYENA